MVGLLTNIWLLIIAIVFITILWPIWLLYSIVINILKPYDIHKGLSKLFKVMAISIDQFWNVICGRLFNDILITKDWYKFWNEDLTISYCLWQNQRKKTLKPLWKFLVYVLDKIEKDHCLITKS